MKAVRKLCLISDTHVGSEYSIWPSGITTARGAGLPQNDLQARLFKVWLEDCKAANDYGVDTIIHFGDICEGTNRKEGGALLTAVSLEIQKQAAVELMRPLVHNKKFYIFIGSGYHHSIDTDICNDITTKLLLTGARKTTNLGQLAYLQVTDKFNIFAKHGADSAVIYTSRKLEAEIRDQMIQHDRGVVPKVNMMLRGHLHNWNYVEKFGIYNAILPAWKCFTPDRVHLKNPLAMISDIGMIFVTVYDDGTFSVTPRIHKMPLKELSLQLLK